MFRVEAAPDTFSRIPDNASATIVETLRALQSCPGVAKLGGVFVCDDASKDDTSKLAADAWAAIPQLTILRNEEQLGERRTVNGAFERVRGDYDWIEPELAKLERESFQSYALVAHAGFRSEGSCNRRLPYEELVERTQVTFSGADLWI
jgi:hypothetical protein